MRMQILAMSFVLLALLTSSALGQCGCACVNGKAQAVCTNVNDVPRYCTQVCPLLAPRVRPVEPARVPPVGTTACRLEQVNGEWISLCR